MSSATLRLSNGAGMAFLGRVRWILGVPGMVGKFHKRCEVGVA